MARRYATVTWDQLHRDARLLATTLMPLGPFRGIVAVTRGGMIPAAIIARELECRLVETISIVAYGAHGAHGAHGDEEVGSAPSPSPNNMAMASSPSTTSSIPA